MCRKANDLARVPAPQLLNLIQLQHIVWGRVYRNTMHEGMRDAAMIEKTHEIIDLAKCQTSRGEQYRLVSIGYPLQKRPVRSRTAGNLDDLDIKLEGQID